MRRERSRSVVVVVEKSANMKSIRVVCARVHIFFYMNMIKLLLCDIICYIYMLLYNLIII